MTNSTLLPAIRSHVGDWNFYVTTLSFMEVVNLIKEPDEIHERKGLSEWIQREAIDTHSEAISNYIIENEQRFLGALIIGVYDGRPDWAPVNVNFSSDFLSLTEDQKSSIDGKLGFLYLTGSERLFAIDGQHRVAGIKKALQHEGIDANLSEENVCAIFVAHDASSVEGRMRTRRLFTTVNKKAKRISKSATIALDEDNGFAVVTRLLIDNHWLFEDDRRHISYTSTGSIPANDANTITSVVGLYEIVKDLFVPNKAKEFELDRPSDDDIDKHFKLCMSYLDALLECIKEYKEVFVREKSTKTKIKAGDFRSGQKNHILFRPIGQRAFAKAVQLLVSRGKNINESIDVLSNVNLYIDSEEWHHILWNPIDRSMITNKVSLAETRLLTLAGENARTAQMQTKLNVFLASLQ